MKPRVTDVGIRTLLELQFGTSIITPKTYHLTVVVSFVDSSIPCHVGTHVSLSS